MKSYRVRLAEYLYQEGLLVRSAFDKRHVGIVVDYTENGYIYLDKGISQESYGPLDTRAVDVFYEGAWVPGNVLIEGLRRFEVGVE